MIQRKYILKDKLAIPCDDLITWAEWFGLPTAPWRGL